jgi:hypothetical protein
MIVDLEVCTHVRTMMLKSQLDGVVGDRNGQTRTE